VPLQDADDTWRNGAVFLLRKPARASGSVSVGGWVTTAVRGKKAVITCMPSSATDFNATFVPWFRATPDTCDANSRWERAPASPAA